MQKSGEQMIIPWKPVKQPTTDNRNALPKGYHLQEYCIQSLLGYGGFGITYLALDTKLKKKVAVKEYFPNDLAIRVQGYNVQAKSKQDIANFTWGLKRFTEEARTLATFQHPNIIKVLRYLEAHKTAYIIMEYEQGESLKKALKSGGRADEEEIMEILPPLLDGLLAVHQAGFLHRDIKPDNIYLRDKDHSPVLLDFGSARYALGSRSRNLTTIVTPGYAPFEQYQTKGHQGPWSDIYALGGVLYRAIGGQIPREAPERVNAIKFSEESDPLVPATQIGRKRYSQALLQGIDWALQIAAKDRPQSVESWAEALLPESTTEQAVKSRFNQWALGAVILVIGLIAGYVFYMQQRLAQLEYEKEKLQQALNTEQPLLVESPISIEEIDTKSGKIIRDRLKNGSLGPEMVMIPAGIFWMGDIQGGGSSDEKPVHFVSVATFAMSRYEVTFAEYDKFAEATGRRKPNDFGWGRGNLPVVDVSWYDAIAYAQWLGSQTGQKYRLPTEAEWEYAARAGTKTKYWWGNEVGSNEANCYGNNCLDNFEYMASVGYFQPNQFGLYDTVGNGWEWTCSQYASNYDGKEQQCVNRADRLVLRGGSWLSSAKKLRSAFRDWGTPTFRNWDVVVRLVRQ